MRRGDVLSFLEVFGVTQNYLATGIRAIRNSSVLAEVRAVKIGVNLSGVAAGGAQPRTNSEGRGIPRF